MTPDIRFPNLGIDLNNISKGFSIFGVKIAWYGVIMATAILVGLFIATRYAKSTNQNPDFYINFSIFAIIFSIIGARTYYVIFSWNEFNGDILKIINLRTGGIAIYGAIIGAVIAGLIWSKLKKYSFSLMADTCAMGLIAGQAIGRWGNFFNREAFGGYTNSLFAMQIKWSDVTQGNLNPDTNNIFVKYNNIDYIQVHPTFLYESVYNLIVLLILFILRKKTKFTGELFLLYLALYGIGRYFIEGLRTDQLRIGTIAVSQYLGLFLFITMLGIVIYKRIKIKKMESNNEKMG